MSLFTWRDAYAVHHPLIDRQHQSLFALADDLHSAMLRGAGRQVVAATLTKLIDYTCSHFRDEEVLMQKSGFPGYTLHKAEHDNFARQVSELKANLLQGHITVTVDTMQFLRNWLEKHIMVCDQQIARHVDSARPASMAGAGAR